MDETKKQPEEITDAPLPASELDKVVGGEPSAELSEPALDEVVGGTAVPTLYKTTDVTLKRGVTS
jgi:hypothetical protein